MATLNITGAITDSQGNSVPFSASATNQPADVITITSVAVTPDPAPVGTIRTLTVVANSSLGLPLTATVTAPGVTLTPVPSSVPGTFMWTFTY